MKKLSSIYHIPVHNKLQEKKKTSERMMKKKSLPPLA